MHQQLIQVTDALDHSQRRLEKLADTVPDDRWNVRSDRKRWSAAECVAHMNLTNAAFVPRIRKAVEEARKLPRVAGREYKRDMLGRIFGAMVGPLPTIGKFRIGRVKTTADFVPSGSFPKQELVAEFKRLHLELESMARESDCLAIDAVRIASPFGEKIHYNVYSAFVMISRHDERHLQQAELVWA